MLANTPTCCPLPPHYERPHFAGSAQHLDELVPAASRSGARVVDVRGAGPAEQLAALEQLHQDTRSRARGGSVRERHALVLDGALLNDGHAIQLIWSIVSVRRLGVHIWIEFDGALPRRLDVQLSRDHCPECVTARIVDGMTAGAIF